MASIGGARTAPVLHGVLRLSATPELSRPYAIERLSAAGLSFALEASEAERCGLIRRFDLLSLDRLEASGTVRVVEGTAGVIEVAGRLSADLSQSCVVTEEPVPARVDADFVRLFSRDVASDAGEVVIDPELDEPEPLEGTEIDVGELVAEELAMALDPYPRSPDADRVLAEVAPGEEDAAAPNPFGALATLRRH
jgi:uncharacterized metal-binding protein YceD (DUF177 family)